MINAALQIFVNKVQVAGRISFGDVKRLQRDILPDGISSREETELLLTLEQTAAWVDAAFGDWLVAMMVDFVVWGMRPTLGSAVGTIVRSRPHPRCGTTATRRRPAVSEPP